MQLPPTQENPVVVLLDTKAFMVCAQGVCEETATRMIHGYCRCGWRTNEVPRRYWSQVLEAADRHTEEAMERSRAWRAGLSHE